MKQYLKFLERKYSIGAMEISKINQTKYLKNIKKNKETKFPMTANKI